MVFCLLQLDKDQGNSLGAYDSGNKSKEKTADQKVMLETILFFIVSRTY